jgi:hypothetical protein
MNTKYTPESIPVETRAELRKLYTFPDYPKWDWDEHEDTWRWELSLYTTDQDPDECVDIWGYVYIAPCKDGQPLEYGTVPEPGHTGWLIGNIYDDIYVAGTLQEAKAVLDNLIQPTPEIPLYVQMSIQPGALVSLTAEELAALKPGDLIGEYNMWGSLLVEHVIADYPGPFACRIYVREQGGKNHGSLVAFTPADHRKRNFVRRVRKPLAELCALLSSLEKRKFEPDYEVARSVGISRAQVNCLEGMVREHPDLVAALLEGTLLLDEVLAIARDEQGQALFHNDELVYTLRS